MSSFTNPLDVRVHNVEWKDKPFELLTAFTYYVGELGSDEFITVPAGYRTDFASIPRVFHRLINPVGRHGKAAVVHDWLCDQSPKTVDHIRAADIFDEAMAVSGVPAARRRAMVLAVKVGGPKFKAGDP